MNDKSKPTHLYHYTTARGLKGIIEKREIWASDIFYLNDWREFYHGRDPMIHQIEELLRGTGESARDRLQGVVKALKQSRTFVCSFSATEEGDDLGQWRGYCPDGGYAIGFPHDKLVAAGAEAHFDLCKCVYWLPGPLPVPQDWLIRMTSDLYSSSDNEVLSLTLAQIAATCKHRSFICENERRLISTPCGSERQLRFRDCGDLLIPYVAIDLSNPDLWKDVHIVVGPCSGDHKELRLESVKMLLESEVRNGRLPPTCARHVRSSNIPYRAAIGG